MGHGRIRLQREWPTTLNASERLNKMRPEKGPLGIATRRSLLTLTKVGTAERQGPCHGFGDWIEEEDETRKGH